MAGDIELLGEHRGMVRKYGLYTDVPQTTPVVDSVSGVHETGNHHYRSENGRRGSRSSAGLGGNPRCGLPHRLSCPMAEDQAAAAAPGPIPSMNSTLSHPTTENVRISSQKNLSLLIMHVQYGSRSSLRLLTCSNIAQNTLPPVVSNALSQHPYSPEVGVAQVRKPCPPPPTPSQTIPLP